MGNSLHNKIYLGRNPLLDSRRIQAALAFGVLAGLALAWSALRGVR
jgi:hypothetical protein